MPVLVDGCSDLDTDGVSDCKETAVENFAFNSDVSSWLPEPSTDIAWTAQDLLEQPGSGSALITSSEALDADGDSLVAAAQCIHVTEGKLVDVFANAYIAAGQVAGAAALSLLFFPAADCPGDTPPSVYETPALFASEEVLTLNGKTGVPPGMVSMRVRLGVIKPFRAESFSVHFDNVLIHVH